MTDYPVYLVRVYVLIGAYHIYRDGFTVDRRARIAPAVRDWANANGLSPAEVSGTVWRKDSHNETRRANPAAVFIGTGKGYYVRWLVDERL